MPVKPWWAAAEVPLIAEFAVYIAYQQWRTGHQKLKHSSGLSNATRCPE